LEWDYKIQPDSDHVAKFQGDRLRDLGDPALKKKHYEHFISPPVTTVNGRPNNNVRSAWGPFRVR